MTTEAHMTASLSRQSYARPVLTADALRQRRLAKPLQRKAIRQFSVMAAFALLASVALPAPLVMAVWALPFAFVGWRFLAIQRQMNFLSEVPITLEQSFASESRLKQCPYRIVMNYTFEGRIYSSPREIDQDDHMAVLNLERSLYALFDRRNPGKILSYRTGPVLPRWLKSRSEDRAEAVSACGLWS